MILRYGICKEYFLISKNEFTEVNVQYFKTNFNNYKNVFLEFTYWYHNSDENAKMASYNELLSFADFSLFEAKVATY